MTGVGTDKRWPGVYGYEKPYWLSLDTGPPGHLENTYLTEEEKKKGSVDIVRCLLLKSTEASGAYRRVGFSSMGECSAGESKKVHIFIPFLLLARQVRMTNLVSQTRDVAAILSR